MNINTDGVVPLSIAPIKQLGMKVALGLNGFPANRMIMCYGKPGGGKSSLLYQIAGEYEENGDEVWIVDSERAIDRLYLASYFPFKNTPEEQINALKHFLKLSEKLLKEQSKMNEEERSLSKESLRIIETRVEILPTLIKEIKDGKPLGESSLGRRKAQALLTLAVGEYRIRNVKVLKPTSMEEFEKETVKLIEARKEDPERRQKRLLIGVDSISSLLTEEVLERTVSSEGSNFNTSRYLHTLIPKMILKLAGTDTTMFFIHQQTTSIKMNPWEQRSAIDDVATKGGSASKFGSTFMIEVEKKKKIKGFDEKDIDTGAISITKAKLRVGGKGNLKGRFYLKESLDQSALDFNEPFLLDILTEEEFGIRKHRGSYYIPANLLENHPTFKETLEPKLREFPNEENGSKYYPCNEQEACKVLLESPAFEEACLDDYGIPAPV
jgi:RecA/RadA recombinase